ncbi:hypothetical protein A3Q56_00125 [Intoshia linei]|uniref:EIPR1-like beta-propeller domain-containing protein n=1 Tax=Intoshia linei TaxID=1819745 RepID=A0A177BES9_9BILA|nr:hypothetical protein A3Q56_00125 [Intoshia linei]
MNFVDPVVYVLEKQTRCMTSVKANSETVSFIVGTQSLTSENAIHQFKFTSDKKLQNTLYTHQNEIWDIASSYFDGNILSTIDPTIQKYSTSVWEMNESENNLELLHTFADSNTLYTLLWNPVQENCIALCNEKSIELYDINEEKAISSNPTFSYLFDKEYMIGRKFTIAKWSMHYGGNQMFCSHDYNVYSFDKRTNKKIDNLFLSHKYQIRDFDFNPNAYYQIVTATDNGFLTFWDVRSAKEPIYSFKVHHNWIWNVRYNPSHDELVLSSSSDTRVKLTRTGNISSAALFETKSEHLEKKYEDDKIEDCVELCLNDKCVSSNSTLNGFDDLRDQTTKNERSANLKKNPHILRTYDDNEDSVYSMEWSSADPWIFASLSYDGRFTINCIDRKIKYEILL